jgi:hypothetical protein
VSRYLAVMNCRGSGWQVSGASEGLKAQLGRDCRGIDIGQSEGMVAEMGEVFFNCNSVLGKGCLGEYVDQ